MSAIKAVIISVFTSAVALRVT